MATAELQQGAGHRRWSFYHPLTITSGGGHIWVASGNSIIELSASTGALVRVINGSSYEFNGPSAMTVLGSRVRVADKSCSVTEFSATTGTLSRVIADPIYGFFAPGAITSGGGDIWVANADGNLVTEISASTGALVRVIRGSNYDFSGPRAITWDGTHVWVLSYNGTVTELSAATGVLVRVVRVLSYYCDAITFGAGHIWATSAGGESVSEFSAATGALVRDLCHEIFPFSSTAQYAVTASCDSGGPLSGSFGIVNLS